MAQRRLLTAIIAIARKKQVSIQAASLAFYAANTLVALVVLVSATLTAVGTENVFAHALEAFTGVNASQFRRLLGQLGGNQSGRLRAVVLAVLITVWSAFRLFGAVATVFTDVYGIRRERSVIRRIIDSVVVLVAVLVLVLAMATGVSVFLFRASGLVSPFLAPVVLWVGLVAVFGPIYFWLSGRQVGVREILPGTLVAATSWTVSALALRFYVTLSRSVDFYGVIGATLLVLTWLYVVGLAVLVGAVLNAYLADRLDVDAEWYPFEEA